ncbi:MAG TPA: PAS domain-containing sensor histidine kinase, partial [Burkholderiaceae bacterium]|nr:PAS domain-containing sensor histidine kinase [Burkholderiaceae bacterium]
MTLAPLVSVLLFLLAIVSAFWYLRNEEIERENESVKRDTEIAQQQIRLRLIDNQEQLLRMAREVVLREVDVKGFVAQAEAFSRERPEVTHVSWINAKGQPKASYSASLFHPELWPNSEAIDPSLPSESRRSEPERAFDSARSTRQPVYSRAFQDPTGTPVFQLYVPL